MNKNKKDGQGPHGEGWKNKKESKLTVALAGNPNCGKTTIFNAITGAHQHVGNWGGVTVDVKEGLYRKGETDITFVDLPGTYSMSAFSMEEKVARDYIVLQKPDVVVQVVDATNLERNLYLTVQLLEMGIRPVLALNMWDEAQDKGISVDLPQLEKLLGMPIVTTIGKHEKGIDTLIAKVQEHVGKGSGKAQFASFTPTIESAAKRLSALLEKVVPDSPYNAQWLSIKLLEDDKESRSYVNELPHSAQVLEELMRSQKQILSADGDEADCLISEGRYGYSTGIVRETVRVDSVKTRVDRSDQIDAVLTHKFWAYPIFVLFLWLLFQATFVLGNYPMEWINTGFELLGQGFEYLLPDGWLQSLIVDGIIGGVGGVAGFLPNILILFLGISIMEDTGYMARAAFIMDKFMHRLGLHGKSFIPMVMGMGCTVPAVMAARTLESEKDRIKTILLTPLISCSARLPVFVLFAGALFPKHAGNVVFLFQVVFGFVAFAIMAIVFKHSLFKREEDMPFVMELPPYRMPTLKKVAIHMWEKAEHYLVKMGTVVLFFSVFLWFAQEYPKQPEIRADFDAQIQVVEQNSALSSEEISAEVLTLNRTAHAAMKKETYIGQFGQILEPLVKPFGTNWAGAVALTAGFIAKEVVVGSMGVLYAASDEDESLQTALSREFTPLSAIAFMFFVLLYTPCIVALTTIVKELNNWKWSVFSVVYQLGLAWGVATLVYQVGKLMGFA